MKKPEYVFLFPGGADIVQAITKKIPMEKLLKLIHQNFKDEGLTSTLIHRIYEST